MEKRGVDCLIFSKDRPAQLDLLLRTLEMHSNGLYRSVTVLSCYSDSPYLHGYATLSGRYQNLNWWLQAKDFQGDVRQWLDRAGEYVSFLCDDDVFIADVDVDEIEPPWSLRAGDYDYPFSLDGSVYLRSDIQHLLEGLSFRNPTRLEAAGHENRSRLPFRTVKHNRTCLVGVPLNRVSADSSMPHLDVHEYDLNERFLAGERLLLTLPDGIVTPHVHPLLIEWEGSVPHGKV